MTSEDFFSRARHHESFRSDIDLLKLEAIKSEGDVGTASAAARVLGCGRNVVVRVLREHGFSSWEEFLSQTEAGVNHKVRAVIPVHLSLPVPVFDLEVEEHSNFALASGVFVHNSKDVADALAGICYTLTQKSAFQPLPIMRSSQFGDGSWLPEQRQAAMAGDTTASQNQDMLPPFLNGSDPFGGWGWGSGR
jgi:hypothetical protein